MKSQQLLISSYDTASGNGVLPTSVTSILNPAKDVTIPQAVMGFCRPLDKVMSGADSIVSYDTASGNGVLPTTKRKVNISEVLMLRYRKR